MNILDASEADLTELLAEMDRVEKEHSWLYICFPPRPTRCVVCGVNKSDAIQNSKPCLPMGLNVTDDGWGS